MSGEATNPAGALSGLRAVLFDAYGTLFDVNAATARCRDVLGAQAASLSALWRAKQLEYSWLRSLRGDFADFWHVTSEALDYAMEALGLEDPALRARLMELYFALGAYPEVPAMLRELKTAGIRTAILSNGSVSMLVGALQTAGIYELVGDILSADAASVFKPHPRVYQLAVDRLSLPPEQMVFVSSNTWDASAAALFGFRVVWIDRGGGGLDRLPGEPVARLSSLAELPSLLAASGGGELMLVIEPSLLTLASEVLDLCRAQHLRLATAESCTGGLIAGCLTAVAGSSLVFDRGFVTYSNTAKIAELGVSADLLARHGAVSEQVARAMAEGAVASAGVDVSVAVTGIAGPDGGSATRPVGLVHFASARAGAATIHQRQVFPGDRQEVRAATVEAALRLLAGRLR